MNDIEKVIEHLERYRYAKGMKEEFLDLAISALEKQSDKNCSRCVDRNRCAIHKNFNIDYCSDWEAEEDNE